MGLFDRDKMDKDAGEWAAIAMACVVFADGTASEAEIAAARGQVATNPVLRHSIGSREGARLFNETVEAVGQIPAAMLASYEVKLATLAKDIKDLDEKNFALTTVIAVAMADRTITQGEYEMLMRFKEMLGASIAVPAPGDSLPREYEKAVHAPAVPAEGAATLPAAEAAGESAPAAIDCPTCGKPAPLYEGYGYWCASCQKYATTPGQEQAADEATEAAPAEQVEVETTAQSAAAGQPVACPSCGKPTQLYEGYGHWCDDCRQYATSQSA